MLISMLTTADRVNWVDSVNKTLHGILSPPLFEADTETTCEEQWIKTEKAADEKERENQWLRAENSRLRELQNAKYASNGPTEGLDDEDFMGAW